MYMSTLERVERHQGSPGLGEPDGRPSLRQANRAACTLTNTTYYFTEQLPATEQSTCMIPPASEPNKKNMHNSGA